PGCQFGYLIKVVKAVYEKYVKNNFNLRAMRGWKQRMDEAVRDYNLRYRNKLAEIYPDYGNSLYRKAMTEAERGDYWRVEIVNTYIASLTKELREKMPIIPDHEKCLETAMTIAENYEKELDDREAKQELIERMNKAGTRRVLVGRMSQPAEYPKDRKSFTPRCLPTLRKKRTSYSILLWKKGTTKRDLELCDTDVLPFDEDDEKLREAAIQAGYALMVRITLLDRFRHTPTILMNVHGKWTQVFIDDGSDVSLISEEQWILFGSPPVEPTDAWVDNTHDRIKFKGVTLLKVCTVNLRETEERFYIKFGLGGNCQYYIATGKRDEFSLKGRSPIGDGLLYITKNKRTTMPPEITPIKGVNDIKNNRTTIHLWNFGTKPINILKNTPVCLAIQLKPDEIISAEDEYVAPEAQWEEDLPDSRRTKPLSNKEMLAIIEIPKQLQPLILKYKDIFYEYMNDPGRYTGMIKHEINLKEDSKIVRKPLRKYRPEQEEAMMTILDDMLKDGQIEKSRSPWASPVLMVKKKTGDWRKVVDYREVNLVTKDETSVLPLIEDILEKVSGKEIYSTIDLASGFFQIPIEKKSKEITAFITPKGLFQYNVTPMGLSGSPSTFQRVMEESFGDMRENVIAYMDDIIVSGKEESHIQDVERVFKKLKEIGMKAKLRKCNFWQKKVEFLGHYVSKDGIEINQKKVEAINKLTIPKNRKELRAFLGATNYFRRFILNYAKLAAPLTKLLSEKEEYSWKEEQQTTFETLKKKLKEAPILAPPDLNRSFVIHTDASEYAVGAVLLQENEEDKKLRLIACASRTLNSIERRWQIVEKEALALVFAIKSFKYYIEGKVTDIFTDQRALLAIKSAKENQTKLRRYQLVLMAHNLNIFYKEGKANVIADLLSRNPEEILREPQVLAITLKREMQGECQEMRPPIKMELFKLSKDEVEELQEKYRDQINIIDEVGYIKVMGREKIYVPKRSRNLLIKEYHENLYLGAHFGNKRLTELIKRYYWWENMQVNINCEKCQKIKYHPNTTCNWVGTWEPATRPWERLNMDIRGRLQTTKRKNEYLLVIVDDFSKYALSIPMRNTKSETIINTLIINVFTIFGYPKAIRLDNATYFSSKEFHNFMDNSGIKLMKSVPYNHDSNGQVERYNRTINETLACYEEDENWDLISPIISHTYNNQIHSITEAIPYEVIFGRRKTPMDMNLRLLNHLNDAELQVDYERLIASVINNLNRQVLKRIMGRIGNESKLKDKYDGPYVIMNIDQTTGNCELSKLLKSGRISHTINRGRRIYNVAHIKQLKLYKTSPGGEEVQVGGESDPQMSSN
uniref:RNA-directed DNA polymerase n=1 Tax=Strongyloides papillosus TaxID=174720 RepID=A0A0N5BUR8_STREA